MKAGLWGASALALAAGAGHAALAQDAGPGSRGGVKGIEEIVVTAQKRSEKLQRVPQSVQVLDSRRLSQLVVNEFTDYLKYLPAVTAQTAGPNQTTLYMRGISDGGNANHSGPLPLVGTYFDEFPTTTIGGNLDIHVYDIARIEVLPGPQGTLYGASSEAGTLRVISNPPNPSRFEAGYDLQGNVLPGRGTFGGVAEGFVNIPVTDRVAVRLVGFDEHDAGYIDNVYGTRTFPSTGGTVNNAALVKNNFNPYDSFGGRATLRVELPDGWTVTPEVIVQDQRSSGIFGYEPSVGDLQVQRFQPDTFHDRWIQAGATVTGQVSIFDVTYSGGFFVRDDNQKTDYTDYSIAYDIAYGSAVNWRDANNNVLPTPLQEITATDHFTKESNEIRFATPADYWLRAIFGGFQEVQEHQIIQDYTIAGLGPQLSVPGYPNTIWLTNQLRTDRDAAAFLEVSADLLPNVTITGGVRPYYYNNSLKGFFGFSQGYDEETGFSSGEGANKQNCLAGHSFGGAPCVDLDKNTSGSGEVHKVNLTWKIDPDRLVYFTYSTGFRPGGVNRNSNFGAYQADSLTNYEVGLKSSWLDRRLIFNAALYNVDWSLFQFSFLGPNSLTIIENAPSANVRGAEFETQFRVTNQLTVTGGLQLNDARLTQNFCGTFAGSTQIIPQCSNDTAIAIKGAALPYTAPVKGNVTARYTFPINDWNAFLQGALEFQSRTQVGLRTVDKATLGSEPSYPVLDFSAGMERKRLSFSFFVKNATDERGQQNRYVACTVGVCQQVYVVPIQPVMLGFKVSQRF